MAEPPRLLRVDMHVHTRASADSLNSPAGVLAALDARGIDRVVIADHDRMDGALRLHALAPERVLVGEEVRTREGPDIIGIFLTEPIPRGTPLRETCERIRAQGGVVYVPHPFDTRRRGGGPLLESVAELVDAVEAHNARTWKPGVNELGEQWARERGKALGAGSDAHTLGEIGTAYVEVPPFEPRRESFLAALRAGRVAARGVSSPVVSVYSAYAKVRKRVLGE
ncbi:MAG TPA: PHP domain-containing protein [Longimicrobiaceae bacterium]|nr:PHP domain-containing protein [Longimicrobiaceae bacterium]